ncbi:DUF401 family protein [bacterium]|nr:DUF401 family protein [bacterium]
MLSPLWGDKALPWVQFAYTGGLAGVFISPAHLCLSMTQKYFGADLGKVLRLLSLPVLIIVLVSGFRLWMGN